MLSPEQVAVRRDRIGASEIGALLGIDPFKNAFDVFAEKTLPPSDAKQAPHQQWGLDIESSILAFHARQRGYRLLPAPGSILHPKAPLVATPDGLAAAAVGTIDLQAKNDQGWSAHAWGEPGTDDAPLLFVAQVMIEMGVLRAAGHDVARGEIAVSLRGAPPVAYDVPFDEELFVGLTDVAAKFIRDHIVTGRAPDITASTVDSAAEWIKRKYPAQRLKLLTPTDEDRALVQLVATMRATGKAAEEEKKVAEVQLKARLGDAEGFEGLCTFKKNKDSIGPNWEKIALAIDAQKATQLARAPEYLTVTREGARVLRLTNGKEK
jgi:predicted phage-related endonuclease